MKKLSLVLLIFLLSLCLIPPTSAAYGDESPESINSFSETLPDDTLFYPDEFRASIETADYGAISDESFSADYVKTHVLDNDPFTESGATDIEIWFEIDTTEGFEGFSYAMYLYASSQTDCDLTFYNFSADLFVKVDEPLPSSYDWMNGTIYDSDFWNTTHIASQIVELSGTADFYWDYGVIQPLLMTLADSDHYADSFADVSDWVFQSGPASPSTDGDVGIQYVVAGLSYNSIYSDIISISDSTGYYAEIRYKRNDSSGQCNFRPIFYDQNGATGGQDASFGFLVPTDVWQTTKVLLGGGVLESFQLKTRSANLMEIQVDYIRVSPANETGWQHDGSTTAGVTEYSGSVSSDGDLVTVSNVSGDAGAGIFFFDTTSTIAKSEDTYYPFVSINVITAEAGTAWNLGYATTDTPSGWGDFFWWIVDETTTGTFRVNLASLSLGTSNIAVLSQDGAITVDYIKIYSIANFTVTEVSDEAATDVLYVDSNVIYSSGVTVDFVELRLDPEISVDVDTYNIWTASIVSGSANFRFRETVDNNNYFSTGVTRGSLTSTTLEEFQFLFYGACALSAIKFIDTHDWQNVGEARFIFPIGWDPVFQFGFDAFFIFAGLIMLPLSTMYLVRGGRNELSMDKTFYFIILFIVGLALLIGGIMP